MSKQFRGVYAIPPTPFTDDDRVDEASLRRCVDFCVERGADGIVAPVNASEGPYLTEGERRRVVEIVVEQSNRRVPVVAGVSGASTRQCVDFARDAASIGADSVMAMPPFIRHPSADEIPGFYAALAGVSDLPIWIQNYVAPVGTPMSAQLVSRLLREIGPVQYLKEETALAPQMMTQVRALAGDALRGVMGGMAGRFLLDEYARGACGTMPACEAVDAHAAVWEALESGQEALARERFRLLLPLLTCEAMYSIVVYKEVLKRRGVIASAKIRAPGSPTLDEAGHRDLDLILKDLEPLFRS